MKFQHLFNQFVRNGGTKIIIVRNSGVSNRMHLNNNTGVETGLYLLGNHPVKDVSVDKDTLKIYLGKPKMEKHNEYHYAHSNNGFTLVDMGEC